MKKPVRKKYSIGFGKYETDYTALPEAERDAKAVEDIRDYCDKKQWDILMQSVGNPVITPHDFDVAFHLIGVQGFPIFAFIRTYRPNEYQAWYDGLPDA